jgi:hypothetical protein
VVGVNKFTIDEEEPYEPLRVDPGIADAQAERLRELRARRDQVAAGKAVDAVKSAAEGTGNVLPPVRDALRAGATLGEVCDALRAVWGTYQPQLSPGGTTPLPDVRACGPDRKDRERIRPAHANQELPPRPKADTGVTGLNWSNRSIEGRFNIPGVETLERHPYGVIRRGHPRASPGGLS